MPRNTDSIPVSSEARKLAEGDPEKALRRALGDGEDFELLFSVSDRNRKKLEKSWKAKDLAPIAWIGKAVKGKAGNITWMSGDKKINIKTQNLGYRHFE